MATSDRTTGEILSDVFIEQICAVPTLLQSAANSVICMNQFTGSTVAISSEDAGVLSRLTTFASSAEHAESIGKKLTIQQAAQLPGFRWLVKSLLRNEPIFKVPRRNTMKSKDSLERLRDLGLIVREREVLDYLKSGAGPLSGIPSISTIAIPTYGRHDSLLECTKSFASYLAKSRPVCRLLVIDDCPDDDVSRHVPEALELVAQQSGGLIEYKSYTQRHELLQKLATTCGYKDELAFALTPNTDLPTDGSARNFITLLTRGEHVMEADDDTRCRYVSLSEDENRRCELSTCADPCEVFFYRDHLEALHKHIPVPGFDPLRLHEEVLGKPIVNIVRDQSEVRFVGVDHIPALSYSRMEGARVGVSATGCIGSPGLYSNAGVVLSNRDSVIPRLVNSEQGYLSAIEGNAILRASNKLHLSRFNYFQSMSHAFDNTGYFPPYFPFGRNSDGILVQMYTATDPRVWFAHHPWAIEHLPISGTVYTESRERAFKRLRLSDLIVLCIASTPIPNGASAPEAMRMVGQYLKTVGSLSPKSFAIFMNSLVMKNWGTVLRYIEEKLSQDQTRDGAYRKDLESLYRNIVELMSAGGPIVPSDLAAIVGGQRAIEMFPGLLIQFGKLLCVWDVICEAAARLVLSGSSTIPTRSNRRKFDGMKE
jgi:hypothetical protein